MLLCYQELCIKIELRCINFELCGVGRVTAYLFDVGIAAAGVTCCRPQRLELTMYQLQVNLDLSARHAFFVYRQVLHDQGGHLSHHGTLKA